MEGAYACDLAFHDGTDLRAVKKNWDTPPPRTSPLTPTPPAFPLILAFLCQTKGELPERSVVSQTGAIPWQIWLLLEQLKQSSCSLECCVELKVVTWRW